MKITIKSVEVELVCPFCGVSTTLSTWSEVGLHQGSRRVICNNCYREYFWSVKAGTDIASDNLPEEKKPIKSY